MSGRPGGDAAAAEPASGAAGGPLRVVVVDDHAMVREGTVGLLQRDPSISVIGQAATGEQAVELLCEMRPDIALVDVELPGISGIEVVRAVHQREVPIRFVVVSAYDDHAYVLEALRAGVSGYLLKTASGRELVSAVRAVGGGSVVFGEEIGQRLTGYATPRAERPPSDLTARESDVLSLIAAGLSNKQIAADLKLGLRTVESHVSNVLSKLGLTSRTEAALYAVRHHLASARPTRDMRRDGAR